MDSILNLPFLATAVSFISIATYYYYKNYFNYWTRKNVKGPTPFPFVGNLATILFSDRLVLDLKWRQKYGKVYGLYQGTQPVLVVADAEVLTQICIKDFDAFPNHDHSEFYNKFQNNFIFTLQNESWKRVRTLMSPIFTSGKIKRMYKFLDTCADDIADCFAEQLQVKNGKKSATVNVRDLYGLFTMDAITTCCYGLKLERADARDIKSAAARNQFVKDATQVFDFGFSRYIILAATPKAVLRYFDIKLLPLSSFTPIESKVNSLLSSRRKIKKNYDDFLQMLIDSKLSDELDLNEMNSEENHHACLNNNSISEDQRKMMNEVSSKSGGKINLSDIEILSSCIFFLAVGLETTSNLLANVTYALAFHQNIQNKLHHEISKIAEYNEDKSKCSFTYESLTSCSYLDAVLSETLRRLPPVVHIDRVSERDYLIEKYNIYMPKGTKLYLNLYAIMNDPDHWYKPEKFDPDRFMPGNKERITPGSYCPFGIGPRHCIGMRFSLTETKIALAKIVMSFRFEPAQGTVFPPATRNILELNSIKKPLVKIIPRPERDQLL